MDSLSKDNISEICIQMPISTLQNFLLVSKNIFGYGKNILVQKIKQRNEEIAIHKRILKNRILTAVNQTKDNLDVVDATDILDGNLRFVELSSLSAEYTHLFLGLSWISFRIWVKKDKYNKILDVMTS